MKDELKGQPCPVCGTNNLTLSERAVDIPHFGTTYAFSMKCEKCDFHKADVEAEEAKEPTEYSIEVDGEDDLSIKVVKSASATIDIPYMTTIEPGDDSLGFITNVEGLLQRVKKVFEMTRDGLDDKKKRKKMTRMIKKLNNVLVGRESIKIKIKDPTGNSAILSDKAEKKEL